MLYNPLIQPISPENFVRRLGFDELLLYSQDDNDSPSFASSNLKHLVRASEYSLQPTWKAHVDTDTISGMPDMPLFIADNVNIEGSIRMNLASTLYHSLEYPIARMFEHMRNSWSGLDSTGNIVSPRDDLISSTPWFSLGSACHGSFVQCMVNTFDLTAKKGSEPIDIEWGIVATGYIPRNAFTIQNLESLIAEPNHLHSRRILYGRDLSITTATDTVDGHFGMPDAGTSIFASGANKPGISDYINEFSIQVDNRLKAKHTAHSHEIDDHRARYAENVMPHAYSPDGQRQVSGKIGWWGNSTPLTFVQKITGPGSVQNRESLIIDAGCIKFEIVDPVWSLAETTNDLGEKQRSAQFSAASDGVLIVPQYDADYS